MNESVKLEQVKKSCKTTAKVAKVVKIIMIVFAVCCLAGSITCFVLNNQINEGIAQAMADENSQVTFNVEDIKIDGLLTFTFKADELEEEGQYGMLSSIYCATAMVILIFMAVIFGILQGMFETIVESETPFSAVVVTKLKNFFIALSILIALLTGLGIGAFTGLVGWCLYNLFEYGYILQQQIDETL